MTESSAQTADSIRFVNRFGAIAWQRTALLRHAHHASGRCPLPGERATAMYLAGRTPPGCAECFGVFGDALAMLWVKREVLRAARVPEALASRILTRWAIDRDRSEAAAWGGLAKPLADRGTPARVREELADPWLVEVFNYLLLTAAARRPVPSDHYGYSALVERYVVAHATDVHPRSTVRTQVRRDVDTVLATVDRVAGRAWRHDHIDAPRMRRRAAYAAVPLHTYRDDGQPAVDPADPWTPDLVGDRLRSAFRAALATQPPLAAAQAGIAVCFPDHPDPLPATGVLSLTGTLLAEIVIAHVGTTATGEPAATISRDTILTAIGRREQPEVVPDRLLTAVQAALPTSRPSPAALSRAET